MQGTGRDFELNIQLSGPPRNLPGAMVRRNLQPIWSFKINQNQPKPSKINQNQPKSTKIHQHPHQNLPNSTKLKKEKTIKIYVFEYFFTVSRVWCLTQESLNNGYRKNIQCSFVLHDLVVGREVALAADLIMAWKILPERLRWQPT